MNRVFFPVIFILWACLNVAFSQPRTTTFSLQQCIETAIANNIGVKQSDLQKQIAEIYWRQSKANLLPNLNGNISHGISQGRSIDPFTNGYVNQQVNYANYGLSSTIVLFNGMSLRNTVHQNAYTYEAAKMDWQQTKDNLTLNVILAYLQVLNNEDLLALSKSQVAVTQKQLERLTILNKAGAISPPLLYDLTGQLKEEQVGIVNNEGALETAKLTLSQLMNIPYDPAMQLERVNVEEIAAKYTTSPAAIYTTATEQLALIKAAELRKKSAAAALKAVRGELLPTIFLNGNLNTNYSSAASKDILLGSSYEPTTNYVVINGSQVPVYAKQYNTASERISYNSQLTNNFSTNVNVGLRVPLFNNLQTRNRIKLAKMDLKNNELKEEAAKVQLRQDVEQAYLNMQNAWSRYNILLDQVAALKESFRAAEVRFQSGVGTSVDYLVVKNNLDRADINLVIARYDYLLRTKILDYYNGTLSIR